SRSRSDRRHGATVVTANRPDFELLGRDFASPSSTSNRQCHNRRVPPVTVAVAPPLAPDSTIDREYRRHRRSVFAGIFVGYAGYYLVRNNLALAIPDILREFPQHSKADLGWALTGTSIAYGTSKFLMGSVSDRSNPKYFLPIVLLLSSAIMFFSGAVKSMY